MGRDGPGKKSRTNSHRLAEWPQFRCNTSWCIDLCATMQRARVFSSLLYQDVMVLDVPEKEPAKKPSVPQSPNCTRRSPPCRLRSSARATARVHGRTILWAPAAAQLPDSWSMQVGAAAAACSPGPVSTDISRCVWWMGAVAAHLRDVFSQIRRRRRTPPACLPRRFAAWQRVQRAAARSGRLPNSRFSTRLRRENARQRAVKSTTMGARRPSLSQRPLPHPHRKRTRRRR